MHTVPGNVGFVMDKVTLGQVFSANFNFSCQFSYHQLLYIQSSSFGTGTVGQIVVDTPSGLTVTPPQEI
jgi:hypothetical protein